MQKQRKSQTIQNAPDETFYKEIKQLNLDNNLCFWSPPVCDLVRQAPRWVTGTSDGRGDACGSSRGGRGRTAPCPWSRDDGDGDGGDDGPWSGHGPARAPWAADHLTVWWC